MLVHEGRQACRHSLVMRIDHDRTLNSISVASSFRCAVSRISYVLQLALAGEAGVPQTLDLEVPGDQQGIVEKPETSALFTSIRSRPGILT